MADEQVPNPYEEFEARSRRWANRIRGSWQRQPHGSWIQLGLLTAGVTYGVLTYRLLQSATRAQQIASQQLEATDRAWIKIDLTLPAPTRIENGSTALFPVWTLTNVGRTVAQQVSNEWSPYVESFSDRVFHEPVERQGVTCSRADWPDRVRAGSVLFPGEANQGMGSFTIEPSTLRDAQERSPRGVATSIIVAGCVAYSYPTSTHRHHTGFIYVLNRQVQPGTAVALTAEWLFSAPLPPGSFTIQPFFFASAPVD